MQLEPYHDFPFARIATLREFLIVKEPRSVFLKIINAVVCESLFIGNFGTA